MSIPVHCAHTRLADPSTLRPNPANPNRHSAHQIQLLASIIQEQGWRNPVSVSKRSGLIVRGHGRPEAALLLGCGSVPVDDQDYASDAEELADLLADNRLSELAELDEDDLRRVLRSIHESDPDFDIELTGFMEDEIRKFERNSLFGLAATGPPLGGSRSGREGVRWLTPRSLMGEPLSRSTPSTMLTSRRPIFSLIFLAGGKAQLQRVEIGCLGSPELRFRYLEFGGGGGRGGGREGE